MVKKVTKSALPTKTKSVRLTRAALQKTTSKKCVALKTAGKAPETKKIAKTKSVSKAKIPAKKHIPPTPKKPVKVAQAPLAKKEVRTPEVPKTTIPLGYTEAQFQKYNHFVKVLEGWANPTLKDALKSNFQSMSGNKSQMAQKVADGMVLGRIPRCPKCYGGRPRFDHKKGTYTCQGYRDDIDYINCHKVFTLSELPRDPWVAPTPIPF